MTFVVLYIIIALVLTLRTVCVLTLYDQPFGCSAPAKPARFFRQFSKLSLTSMGLGTYTSHRDGSGAIVKSITKDSSMLVSARPAGEVAGLSPGG